MPYLKRVRCRVADIVAADDTGQSAIQSRRGAVVVMAALLMVPIFGFVAFSVDTGYMVIVKTELQTACDAAALAGANELANGESEVKKVAKALAKANKAGGNPVILEDADIEVGVYDLSTHTFTPTTASPNAVRVTARVVDQPLFFAPVIGHDDFDLELQAIAMLNPREICFAVDLSGSMNDDTEPCWATKEITDEFSSQGYPDVATDLMEQVFSDLGFGAYPGTYEYLGKDLGVSSNSYAYGEMTDDDGPLSQGSKPAWYRINSNDSESTRKTKAYRWIIDEQIQRLMPAAKPYPDSQNAASFEYWSKYIDYIIRARRYKNVEDDGSSGGSGGGSSGGGGGGGSSPPPPPPPPGPGYGNVLPKRFGTQFREIFSDEPRDLGQVASGNIATTVQMLTGSASIGAPPKGFPRNGSEYGNYWLPPSQDKDRIYRSWKENGVRVYGFNNPNKTSFSSASTSTPKNWRNKIGYITYVQFMMDWGRDRSPDIDNDSNAAPGVGIKTQLSALSPYCTYHNEVTAGGNFSFPPREMPTHALRRALIAALQLVKDQNKAISGTSKGDRVAIVTFDGLSPHHAPAVQVALTSDYVAAMAGCTQLQATSDIGRTTATEAGLFLARNHLKPVAEGGVGRDFAKRVIVLLTDGSPNEWQSPDADINAFVDDYNAENPGNGNMYDKAYLWMNAPLMQAGQFLAEDDGIMFSVGIGLGTNYDFMDRMSRTSDSAENGQSPRGSGNPAEYEQRLTDMLKQIIRNPGTRLVQ